MAAKRSVKPAVEPVSADTIDEAARAVAIHSPDGMVIVRAPGDWICSFANEAARRQFGPEGPPIGQPFLDAFPASSRPMIAAALDEAHQSGEPRDVLAQYQHAEAVLELRIIPIADGVAIHFRDLSILALRERQQAAAAALGLKAISGARLDELFTDAVELVRSALAVDFVYVAQIRRNELIVRAHVGRRDIDPVGRVLDAKGSIVSYVVSTGQPVVTADFARETRYDPPPAVHEASARSAAAVPIRGRHGAFGALIVMNRATHAFRPEDIAFLQTSANVLAAAVDRSADEVAIHAAEAELLASLNAAKMVAWEWNSITDELRLVGATQAFGLPGVSNIRGEVMIDLLHPDDRGAFRAGLRTSASGKTEFRNRFRIVRRTDGKTIWFEAQGTSLADGRGVRGLAADISARVEAEDALKHQEELFRAITEFGRELIVIVNDTGAMTYVSPSGARMLGHDVASVTNRPLLELIHPDDSARVTVVLMEIATEANAVRPFTARARMQDGTWMTLEATGYNMLHHPAVRGIVINARDVTARVAAEAALRESEIRYRMLFESSPIATYLVDTESSLVVDANAAMLRQYGYDAEDLGTITATDLLAPATRLESVNRIEAGSRDGGEFEGQFDHVRKDGAVVQVQVWSHPVAATDDRLRIITALDVSPIHQAQEALRQSEEQLHQALKMEAVGRLAGGIAHDFNNLLTAIRGYSDMVSSGLRPSDPLRADVQEIQRAADRAASLTHQLLAFSRRQVLRPDRLEPSSVVRDLERMVRRLIGEDIDLTVNATATRTVLVDRGQIEQVILNLVINARDAMPTGGHLTIEALDHDIPGTVEIREGSPPPGRYALLRVEDSGGGIPSEILDRVFEPFFTTKGPGKGTGLGLSTAYGIVKQSGGFIEVTSIEGAGTTFRIYLPESEDGEVRDRARLSMEMQAVESVGGETILLVEDADAVRQVVRRALTKMGYRVLEASNGPQAIGVALEHANEIDLVLSDFVMPHMGGRELIDRLRELGLTPKILIMSGYIDDALLRGGGFPPGAAFIEKPFTADVIGRKVREVLDGVHSHTVPKPY